MRGMSDAQVVRIASRQFNRFARAQVFEAGLGEDDIDRRVRNGRWTRKHRGVFAIAPALEDPWGRWKGATLTAVETFLSHEHGGAAWGVWWMPDNGPVSVTRPGSAGTRIYDGLRLHRSDTVLAHVTKLRGVPITTVERTLIDLAPRATVRQLARAVREAVRLELTTVHQLADALGAHYKRRGTRKLAGVLARYSGLPIERARSASEVRALEILRDAGRPMPELNVRIAGEEGDLVWRRLRRIIEIDGGPFHLDAGEDARKQLAWEGADFRVDRLPSSAVFADPQRLLDLAPR